VQVPANASAGLAVSAVVPQADGSLTVLKGSTTSAGVITIPNVPAGYYWLTFSSVSLLAPQPAAAYWTSTSTFDAGRDVGGSPVPVLSSPMKTTFDFNLSGLDSATAPTSVEFATAGSFLPPVLYDLTGSPTLSETFAYDSNLDWSQINTAFLLQYEPVSLGSLNNLVLGPELTLSNLALTDGATNAISATLQPSRQAALSLSVSGLQWASLFANAGPAPAIPYSSALAVYAEQFVTGRNALGVGFGSNLALSSTALGGSSFGFSFQPFGGCDLTGFPLLSIASQPAIFTDQNFGTLQYGDPFPSAWTRALSFCQEATVPIAIPNSSATANFALVDAETVTPSNSPLSPLVFPVQNPTINGASFFSANTVNTTSLTLSWSAPGGTKPYGYRVSTFVQTTVFHGAQGYQPAAVYHTAQTSVTLPPLSGGNAYVFAITAEVDGAANMETSPYRSALPTGFASVVSAPVAISSGARGAGHPGRRPGGDAAFAAR
jgi:hypothetical protein